MSETFEEPKPHHCPFCGSRRIITLNEGDYPYQIFWKTCDKCKACGPTTLTKDSAIEAWNERNATDLEDDTDE